MSLEVSGVAWTELFVGTRDDPHQVVWVALTAPTDPGPAPTVRVTVEGDGVTTPHPVTVSAGEVSGREDPRVVEVAVTVAERHPPGSEVGVQVLFDGHPAPGASAGTLVVAETGWTMVMVNHFHYDPVWWNTQAAYTSDWDRLDFSGSSRGPRQQSGFALMRAHLDMARRDPDYCFVLAELDYLKPFWAAHPEYRQELRGLLRDGRCELVGGTYNEPNTNLTAAETTVRNLVHGIGFQRDVMGGRPATAWQLDAFGHDPGFPGLCADAGLTSSSWARGPFHQWGPAVRYDGVPGDVAAMQFPSEFEWISPSGRGLLTAYMANHYSAGWRMDQAADLAGAEEQAYWHFFALKKVAAGRTVLLPVGSDYTPPNRWVTRIHRSWPGRYVWPRFVCGLPSQFFAMVRADLAAAGRSLSPQTRDMNPIYTGKDVSYIDTKQAHRAGEQAATEAETFATFAALLGARYPHAALDKAWRHLLYGAHHDAVTGSESDQVYLDLLTNWREAVDLAADARDRAQRFLAGRVDTRAPAAVAEAGAAIPVTVFNALSWTRTDLVRVEVTLPTPGVRALDVAGGAEPVVVEAATTWPDGSLRTAVVSFLARDVPGIGYRTVHLVPAPATAQGRRWEPADGSVAASDRFRITADPARGGALSSIHDLRSGRELVTPGDVANELVVHDEYPAHPLFGEGPWHLVPSGERHGSREGGAEVRLERSALGERLVVRGEVGPVAYTQTVSVHHGLDRVDCRTRLDRFTGSDQLVRVRFPVAVPGALPVSEVAGAVIGRGFGLIDVDSAGLPWTLDNPAYTWAGLSRAACVTVVPRPPDAAGRPAPPTHRAIGIAEVVVPAALDQARVRPLVVALGQRGVTATTSTDDGSRYGLLAVDSNLPDVRVVVGGPDRNSFAAAVLAAAEPAYQDEVKRQLAETSRARVWVPGARPLADVWVPGADLRAADALDVLLVDGADDAALDDALDALAADLGDAVIVVDQQVDPAGPGGVAPFEDRTVALLNRGVPGFAVTTDGAINLSLVRSCTGWPSGVWIDPPRRAAPDGSAFQLQHWTHEFDYALVAGAGDWRAVGAVEAGAQFNAPLRAVVGAPQDGPLPPAGALLTAESDDASFLVTAVKPTGNPLACGRVPGPVDAVTVRGHRPSGQSGRVRIEGMPRWRAAAGADLLEGERAAARVDDGAAVLEHGPGETLTAVLRPEPAPAPASEGEGALGAAAEVVQPVFTRYWLHNSGTAPLGNVPVAVHLHPTRVAVEGGERTVPLRVTVARDAGEPGSVRAGLVAIRLPEGWAAQPARLPYELAAGGWAEYDVAVTVPAAAAPGRYAVEARIQDGGQELADLTVVTVGETPVLDDQENPGGGISVVWAPGTTGASAPAGGEAQVTALVSNDTHTEATVAVWAISPYGSWDYLGPGQQALRVPPRSTAPVQVDVRPSVDQPAAETWLLLKVAWADQVRYGPAIPVRVGGPAG
jgi:alpha-mannosidase